MCVAALATESVGMSATASCEGSGPISSAFCDESDGTSVFENTSVTGPLHSLLRFMFCIPSSVVSAPAMLRDAASGSEFDATARMIARMTVGRSALGKRSASRSLRSLMDRCEAASVNSRAFALLMCGASIAIAVRLSLPAAIASRTNGNRRPTRAARILQNASDLLIWRCRMQ